MSGSLDIPLFPLNTVLFPGGRLPLRIFEQRYMDMAKVCIRDSLPFGVCLLEQGSEVSAPSQAPARPEGFGTLARIGDWDMPQFGVLNIATRGEERFRVIATQREKSGLLRGEVEPIAQPTVQPIPADYARLVPLLRVIVTDMADAAPPEPHRFDDANWVGYRYCEVLPISNAARQKLLELQDSMSRLEIIFRFLEQKKLLVA
jgi:Lon protease-like protein